MGSYRIIQMGIRKWIINHLSTNDDRYFYATLVSITFLSIFTISIVGLLVLIKLIFLSFAVFLLYYLLITLFPILFKRLYYWAKFSE